MIKKILNTRLMEDSETSAGGGGWDLDINPSGLEGAASAYTKAVEDYKDAKAQVTAAFNAIASNTSWQDISTDSDYQTKIDEIIKRLDAIETTLTKNSSNLTKIATYASTTESSVHTSIVGIG
jgi:hypothetical protein